MEEITLYILRHGETDMNVRGRLQGILDAPLNKNGVRAATLTGRALRDVEFHRVISSPLIRAVETARLILAEGGRDLPIETDPRLGEISFGEWEGRSSMPGSGEVPRQDVLDFFYDPLRYRGAPGGETIADVCRRTADFLTELLHDPENSGKTILLSTHGCAMRALLRPVYQAEAGEKCDFWHGNRPPNCAVNIARTQGGVLKLLEEDRVYW